MRKAWNKNGIEHPKRLAGNEHIVVSRENALDVLRYQQSLPARRIDAALVMECVDWVVGDYRVEPSAQERVWKAICEKIGGDGLPQSGRRRLRPAVVLTAALLAVLLVAGVCLAAGILPWKLVINRGQETFELIAQRDSEYGLGQTGVAHTGLSEEFDRQLQNYQIEAALPRWVPEGFVASNVILPLPEESAVYVSCEFWRGKEEFITLSVEDLFYEMDTIIEIETEYEMNGDEVEVYTKNGIDYYIYTNLRTQYAKWRVGSYECTISGTISEDEIKQMIDSITEEE